MHLTFPSRGQEVLGSWKGAAAANCKQQNPATQLRHLGWQRTSYSWPSLLLLHLLWVLKWQSNLLALAGRDQKCSSTFLSSIPRIQHESPLLILLPAVRD